MKTGKIEHGDILIVKDGATTGKLALFTKDFPLKEVAINEHVFALRINRDKADIDYVFNFLKSADGQRRILLDFRGATVGGISRDFVNKTKIPLPDLKRQRVVAQQLIAANNLMVKRRQAIEKINSLSQAIFLEMFGDSMAVRQKWKIKPLSDNIVFLTSGSRGWAKYYSEIGDVFIRIQNVTDGKLILDDVAYVNAPNTAEAKRTKVAKGDVLISITADLGRTAVVPQLKSDAFINQHLALVRVKDILPEFLALQLSMPFGQNQFMSKNKQGVKAGLNFDDIKTLKIFHPPIELQKSFIEKTEKVKSILNVTSDSQIKLNSLFASVQKKCFGV